RHRRARRRVRRPGQPNARLHPRVARAGVPRPGRRGGGAAVLRGAIRRRRRVTMTIAEYARLMRTTEDATSTTHTPGERRALERASRQAYRDLVAAFGDINGWTPTDKVFNPGTIGSGVPRAYQRYALDWRDQPIYYRAGRTCAAIVGQPYGPLRN